MVTTNTFSGAWPNYSNLNGRIYDYGNYSSPIINAIEQLGSASSSNVNTNNIEIKNIEEEDKPMPIGVTISDIKIIKENKVVECIIDGQKYKSICDDDDKFSLETAITICICKRLLGGSSKYNNSIKKAIKKYNDKIKREQEQKEKEAAEKDRIKKKREKNRLRRIKNNQKKQDIQKNAYKDAIKELIDEGVLSGRDIISSVNETPEVKDIINRSK